MSDYVIKVIPTKPNHHISGQQTGKILEYLKAGIRADDICAKSYENPVFIDCGSNLEKIECPLCGAALDFGWWDEAMDAASEGGFGELSVKLPCCGGKSTLNELRYHFPCGFSCVEFDIRNPLEEPDEQCLERIRQWMGTPVRLIRAHY